MTISIKHKFTSPKADGADSTVVQPSNWNDEHNLTLAGGKVLGRDTSGAGAMQELPLAFDPTGQSMVPPSGTTAQRPASATAGMVRYNTTTLKVEVFTNGAWSNVGGSAAVSATAPTSPQPGDLWYDTTTAQLKTWDGTSWQLPQSTIVVDVLSGNGSTVTFTLSGSPGVKNNTNVFISGVYQAKATYSITSNSITFSTAPPAGTNNIEVEYSSSLVLGTPNDGSVRHATAVAGGVNALQFTFSPTSTGWTQYERIYWTSLGANTITAPTVSKDGGVTNKTLKRSDGSALALGDLGPAGYECELVYNGTDCYLQNPATLVSAYKSQFNGIIASKEQTVTFVAAPTVTNIDLSLGADAVVTLTGNWSLGPFANQSSNVGARGQIRIIQDATGGRTVAFDAVYAQNSGYALSVNSAPNSTSIFNYWIKAGSGSGSIILTPVSWGFGPHIVMEDQKASGTNGQFPTANTDTQLNLNTVTANQYNLTSLTSNQFTLPAGTYYANFWTSMIDAQASRVFLYNVTDAAIAVLGSQVIQYAQGTYSMTVRPMGAGVFTITSQKTFELRIRQTNNHAIGTYISDGRNEIYSHIEITKLA